MPRQYQDQVMPQDNSIMSAIRGNIADFGLNFWDKYKANVEAARSRVPGEFQAKRFEDHPLTYRKRLLAQNNRDVLAQGTQAFKERIQKQQSLQQQQAQLEKDRVQQAVGLKSKKTIETDPTGKQTIKQNFKIADGTEVTIKSEENPYQQQYEQMLQQGMQETGGLNLQPIAQLVDQWTGSQFAPGMARQRQQQQTEQANRIRMAGALAGEGQKPIDRAEAKRRWEAEMQLKRDQLGIQRLRAMKSTKNDADVSKLVGRAKLGKDKAIQYHNLSKVLSKQGVREQTIQGLSKDQSLRKAGITVLPGWDGPLEVMMNNPSATDLEPQKLAMLEATIRNELKTHPYEYVRDRVHELSSYVDEQVQRIAAHYGAE